MLDDRAERPLEVFRAINTAGTVRLAQQAAEMGIRRFVFLSSIGVNGVRSTRPFTEADAPAPQEPYAVSKLEAEHALMQIAEKTGMEVVILRPPLVYGPDAPGNFGRLLGAVRRGLPLPLGAVTHNRRTLVALDNLVDLIVTCVTHPAAANQIFLAGDSEDLSTADLLRRLAQALAVPLRLLPVPVWLLSATATMLGKRAMIDRLCGSLQVDISKARELLGWSPPLSVDEALRRTASHYRARNGG
jgi:nucleoside-diphosphate-sugar epimerase